MLMTVSRDNAQRSPALTAEFLDTEFMHDESEADYSGFAPTQWLECEYRQLPCSAVAGRRAGAAGASATPRKLRLDALGKPVTRCSAADEAAALSAARATAHWVEEQETRALQAQSQAQARAALVARGLLVPTTEPASAEAARGQWLARLEAAIGRVLPPNLGSLFQLFICVSLSIGLMSSLLPLVDKI